jgi:hypothetical protein
MHSSVPRVHTKTWIRAVGFGRWECHAMWRVSMLESWNLKGGGVVVHAQGRTAQSV